MGLDWSLGFFLCILSLLLRCGDALFTTPRAEAERDAPGAARAPLSSKRTGVAILEQGRVRVQIRRRANRGRVTCSMRPARTCDEGRRVRDASSRQPQPDAERVTELTELTLSSLLPRIPTFLCLSTAIVVHTDFLLAPTNVHPQAPDTPTHPKDEAASERNDEPPPLHLLKLAPRPTRALVLVRRPTRPDPLLQLQPQRAGTTFIILLLFINCKIHSIYSAELDPYLHLLTSQSPLYPTSPPAATTPTEAHRRRDHPAVLPHWPTTASKVRI